MLFLKATLILGLILYERKFQSSGGDERELCINSDEAPGVGTVSSETTPLLGAENDGAATGNSASEICVVSEVLG